MLDRTTGKKSVKNSDLRRERAQTPVENHKLKEKGRFTATPAEEKKRRGPGAKTEGSRSTTEGRRAGGKDELGSDRMEMEQGGDGGGNGIAKHNTGKDRRGGGGKVIPARDAIGRNVLPSDSERRRVKPKMGVWFTWERREGGS